MSFSPVGSPIAASASGFSLTPGGVGDIIVIVPISLTGADTVTALSSTNVTWAQLVAPQAVGGPAATVFLGKVTSTSTAPVTVTVSAGSPSLRIQGQEFSTTAGASAVTLDTSGPMAGTTGGAYVSLTPAHGSGELYYGFAYNSGSGSPGSTSGYSYNVDGNGNGACYNPACGTGAQQPTWADTSDDVFGVSVLLYEASATPTATPRPVIAPSQAAIRAASW